METMNPIEWDAFISRFPSPHILQTSAWGQLKVDFGWRLVYNVSPTCGAQILIKQILPGINFAYIPKGPVGTDWNSLWSAIDPICKKSHCAFLKVEPDIWETEDNHGDASQTFIPTGFIQSTHTIQPQRTLVIDLTSEESQILGRMKQKTRYNINLALKKNVVIQPHTDLTAFYDLMKITGQRDQFGIHSLEYYQRAFDLFHAHGQCQLLLAEFEGEPISALIVFSVGDRAWYFYGASSDLHRDRMPNYLLQWEAMRWAKSEGCVEYDLWGVPDVDLEILEANFTSLSDGLWGVYRFKRGFGGKLKRSVGAWDRVYNPLMYRAYSLWQKYRKVEA
jgi:lipid II:glycine glycyltransferase (peptidoglycan interpeptide bridge formation enzyme)